MAIEYTHMGFMTIDEAESEAKAESLRNLERRLQEKITKGTLSKENEESAGDVIKTLRKYSNY